MDDSPPTASNNNFGIIYLVGRGFCKHHFNYWRITMSNNKTPMTPKAAARIQSVTAKQNGGQVPKDSFAAKASSSAAKNTNNGR